MGFLSGRYLARVGRAPGGGGPVGVGKRLHLGPQGCGLGKSLMMLRENVLAFNPGVQAPGVQSPRGCLRGSSVKAGPGVPTLALEPGLPGARGKFPVGMVYPEHRNAQTSSAFWCGCRRPRKGSCGRERVARGPVWEALCVCLQHVGWGGERTPRRPIRAVPGMSPQAACWLLGGRTPFPFASLTVSLPWRPSPALLPPPASVAPHEQGLLERDKGPFHSLVCSHSLSVWLGLGHTKPAISQSTCSCVGVW